MARTLAGRYRLTSRLGAGATGQVWRAEDRGTDRPVAVKLLHQQFATDPRLADRLLGARRALGELWHPGIARLVDVVVEDGVVALVADFVPGADLARLLASTGPLPPARAAEIAGTVADALAAAHHAGVVHGDLKPTNVIIPDTRGPARLTDFSVAMLARVGTPAHPAGASPYHAPWAIDGTLPTASGDVHALGVLLWEMLTGSPDYPAGGAGIDPRLVDVVDHCLVGEQHERPSAGTVAQRLRELAPQLPRTRPAGGSGPPALPAGTAGPRRRPARRPGRRRTRTRLMIAGALVVVAAAAVGLVNLVSRSEPAGSEPTLDPTDTTSAAGPPALPEGATAHTPAGGGEFVAYWFATLTYAVRTGDAAPLAEVTHTQCQDCQQAVGVIESTYAGGGALRGGAYVVRRVTTADIWSQDRPVYDAVVDRSARTTVDAGGETGEDLPALSFVNCVMVLEWAEERWQVREVVTPECVA